MNDSQDKKDSGLNPAQEAVLEQLGSSREERPVFSEDLGYHIRGALETAIEPYLSVLPPAKTSFLRNTNLGKFMDAKLSIWQNVITNLNGQ